jgi:hypothetical protein
MEIADEDNGNCNQDWGRDWSLCLGGLHWNRFRAERTCSVQ